MPEREPGQLEKAFTAARANTNNQSQVKRYAVEQAWNLLTNANVFDPPLPKLIIDDREKLTVQEAQDELSVSRTTVRWMINAGKIQADLIGNKFFIDRESFDAYKAVRKPRKK